MNERTRPRTASSKGSNHSLRANGDGGGGKAGVASFMAWVPSRSCRSEPTPPQPISTNLATRPTIRMAAAIAELEKEDETLAETEFERGTARRHKPGHAKERSSAA